VPGSLVGVRFVDRSGGPVPDMNTPATGPGDAFDPDAVRAARQVSEVSIAWTLVVSSLAIASGIASGSSALVAFGAVGYVDLVGSVALVHHFRHALRTDALSDHFEARAHRIVTFGLLGIGLATVVISSVRLVGGHHPKTSTAGIVLAAISIVGLGLLSTRKVQVAPRVPSAALRSDGLLSAVGAAQAGVVLVGTGASSALSWHWADDTAAIVVGLVAIVIAARTGRGQGES
jgi:divalent metal cation (Fe/Co/Zn/Cd) transporter